ncbi:BA14K family protein [Aureimonas sp. ME7]|uniref:BA14K family protein n=1 Tax=Aureimonas sp. ME7 TaxID=2744252 RepID=UPI001FCF1DF3|nr:BA14K family protein [Aureimonas sp. ME7]
MRISKLWGGRVLAAVLAFTMVPAALPSATPLVGVTAAKADPFYRHHRGGPGWGGPRYYGNRGYYGGRGYYGNRGYYRHRGHSGGAAVAGAIVGLGVGAAIASAAQPRYVERPVRRYAAPAYRAEPWSREWYRYCAARYRSFDPGSGTFQPYNGPRQFCR